jgi:aminoacyl-tRNA hydrolase
MAGSGLGGATRRLARTLGKKPGRARKGSKWLNPHELRYGLYKRLVQPAYERLFWLVASAHRARLKDTVFIGVTGSVGKTTTRNFVHSVLATTYVGHVQDGTRNNVHSAARSIRECARRGDGFHVVEVSAPEPGWLPRQLEIVRPSIGVVTAIGSDHYTAWGSVDAIAHEKGRLIRSLPPDGIAILNADDPRVIAMAAQFAGRLITFGTSPDAAVRAVNVAYSWPDRLSFDLVHGNQSVFVQTRMYGPQWVPAALAGAAVGIAFGIPLETIVQGLARLEPVPARMSPVVLPDGVSFVRDDCKAPIGSIPPALEFLRTARARRKIAIIGTISDISGNAGRAYVKTARQALAVADVVCFVGPRAFVALPAKTEADGERLKAFGTVRAAQEFLGSFLAPGDLVLLKGSNAADHLYRLILSRTSHVACWRMDCKRHGYCDRCELVGVPSGARPITPEVAGVVETAAGGDESPVRQTPLLIVGLGNPGGHRNDTPHNVGFGVIDRLAARANATFRADGTVDLTEIELAGEAVRLVKPRAVINGSGSALSALAARQPFQPEQCVLVYDDLDLPLGAVRSRLRGSDGGHRGVRSILEVFQSDQFPRIKVGVRRAGSVASNKEAVLAPFTPEEQPALDAAFTEAERRLLALVRQLTRERSRPGPAGTV